MASMGDINLFEPASSCQLDYILDFSINKTDSSSFIRLTSIPYKKIIFKNESFKKIGAGTVLEDGNEISIISIGPVMTNMGLELVEYIKQNMGLDCKLITTPWLNHFDIKWYKKNLKNSKFIITLENHYTKYGFGNYFISQLAINNLINNVKVKQIGLNQNQHVDPMMRFCHIIH